MIDYEILVQTIADWKAGVRPTAPLPPAAPESVEELSSGVVDFDEETGYVSEAAPETEYEYETEYEVDNGQEAYTDEGDSEGYDPSQYEQPQYEQPQYEQPQYEQSQYDQSQYDQSQYEQPVETDEEDE